MATLQDYLGITKLRDAWPKWKANVIAVNNQVINHVAGTADKHAAQDITYSGGFTSMADVKAALDQAKTEMDTIVVNASVDPEVALARVSAVKAKTFTTLDARLEESEQDLVSTQADNAKYIRPTGTGDDTDLLISSMLDVNTLIFKPGIYYVDLPRNVKIPSNITLVWEEGAVFQGLINVANATSMLTIEDVENVTLVNPQIIGDKDTHVSQDSQGDHGIRIGSALARTGQPRAGYTTKNIKIFNPRCSKNMGDGIYVNDAENVYIENAICDTNHRMGIAVISGKNIRITNPQCINSTGLANTVSSGIDLEPNLATDELDGIFIDQPYVSNTANQKGLIVSLSNLRGGTSTVNVFIETPHLDGRGIVISNNPAGVIGIIEINNPIVRNSLQAGISLVACEYTGAKIRINNPGIYGWNTLPGASTIYSAGITIYTDGGAVEGLTNMGNIELNNVKLETINVVPYGLTIHDAKNSLPPKNITINGIEIEGGTNSYYIPYVDKTLKIKNDISSPQEYTSATIDLVNVKNLNWFYSRVASTGSVILYTTWNEFESDICVTNIGAGTLSLYFDLVATPTLYPFYPFSASCKGIKTTDKYGSVKFKKTVDGYVATKIVGTWVIVP